MEDSPQGSWKFLFPGLNIPGSANLPKYDRVSTVTFYHFSTLFFSSLSLECRGRGLTVHSPQKATFPRLLETAPSLWLSALWLPPIHWQAEIIVQTSRGRDISIFLGTLSTCTQALVLLVMVLSLVLQRKHWVPSVQMDQMWRHCPLLVGSPTVCVDFLGDTKSRNLRIVLEF